MRSPNNSNKALSLISSGKCEPYNVLSSSWTRKNFSGSLNFVVFVGWSSDFFRLPRRLLCFVGFVVVDVFEFVAVDDNDISDAQNKFTICSSCFALRLENEWVATFCVSRSDWIILSFILRSFLSSNVLLKEVSVSVNPCSFLKIW